MDLVIATALEQNQLLAMGSGCSGPCIDLRRIDAQFAQACSDADLVILEVN